MQGLKFGSINSEVFILTALNFRKWFLLLFRKSERQKGYSMITYSIVRTMTMITITLAKETYYLLRFRILSTLCYQGRLGGYKTATRPPDSRAFFSLRTGSSSGLWKGLQGCCYSLQTRLPSHGLAWHKDHFGGIYGQVTTTVNSQGRDHTLGWG